MTSFFSPPEKKKPYPVIFYHELWHHLEYDRDEDDMYLGPDFPLVHEYDPTEEEPQPDSPVLIKADNLDQTIRNSLIDPTTCSLRAAHK